MRSESLVFNCISRVIIVQFGMGMRRVYLILGVVGDI